MCTRVNGDRPAPIIFVHCLLITRFMRLSAGDELWIVSFFPVPKSERS